MNIVQRSFQEQDFQAVCDFLTELNRENRDHIHWNWARFEWMYGHPEFDRSTLDAIGLWCAGERIVGAAIYDMYFGEAFCGVLPEYGDLYPELLDYAWRALRDENGLGICICETNRRELAAAAAAGFTAAEATETILARELNGPLTAALPGDLSLRELDPGKDEEALQWLFWQGFDHGNDRAAFEEQGRAPGRPRPHFDLRLSLGAVSGAGEPVSACCLWYQPGTDYAYVEPVCTIPEYRGRGAARALLFEAMNRARALGAKRAYVISDQEFYKRIGFVLDRRFRFYWKK